MSYEAIIYESSAEGVATITLNRPQRLNAFNQQMCLDLANVWTEIREDDSINSVVIRAAGDRAFSTGVDVIEGPDGKGHLSDHRGKPWEWEDPSRELGPKSNRVWKPIICAVHGMFAGGAFYFLNESDIVICSEDATFFDPHVTFGQVSACEPTGMLGRIPYGEILRIVLMGNDERVSAQTALRIGLVSEVVPRERLFSRAHEIAAIIAAKASVATQGTVRAVWEGRDLPASSAVMNAYKYTQLGNPVGQALVDRKTVPKAKWTLR